MEYHWGPPGIGKSTRATSKFPTVFLKDCDTKWWDNYQGQPVVILDDFPGVMTALIAKKWLGEVNVPLEVKGGATEMRYNRIFITSNVPPEDCFEQAKQVHRDAFMRRIGKVFEYAWSNAPLTQESTDKGYTSERTVVQTKGNQITIIKNGV